ncbi:MAG: tetratricopeptide repeat protein [Longimicrobiales bacterium]
MKTPAPADLQRWSEELARNPASLAFLPLARAYRRLGRRDLAVQLCLRGLEHHPTHVEAHALLALLHFESGDRARAADEWATVLRLKPGNFEALRGMGFRYLEQNEIAKARNHLERAALIRPEDATVQEALRLIRQRETAPVRPSPSIAADAVNVAANAGGPAHAARVANAAAPGQGAGRGESTLIHGETGAASSPTASPSPRTPKPEPAERSVTPRFMPATAPAAKAPPPRTVRGSVWAGDPTIPPDPTRLFEEMATGPLLGVLLLDRRGLVLAGSLRGDGDGAAEELGALIGAAIEEAARTIEHLRLDGWRMLLLECAAATIQVAPVGDSAMVVVAARRGAPMGWVGRSALHAVSVAERFMEAYA